MRNRAILIAVALITTSFIAGCGGGDSAVVTERGVTTAEDLSGVWSLQSNLNQTMVQNTCKSPDADEILLEFLEDGTLVQSEYCDGALLNTCDGSWQWDGDRLQVTWASCDSALEGGIYGNALIVAANWGTPDRVEMHFAQID